MKSISHTLISSVCGGSPLKNSFVTTRSRTTGQEIQKPSNNTTELSVHYDKCYVKYINKHIDKELSFFKLMVIIFVKYQIFCIVYTTFVKYQIFCIVYTTFVKYQIFRIVYTTFVKYQIFCIVYTTFVKYQIFRIVYTTFVKYQIFCIVYTTFVKYQIFCIVYTTFVKYQIFRIVHKRPSQIVFTPNFIIYFRYLIIIFTIKLFDCRNQ